MVVTIGGGDRAWRARWPDPPHVDVTRPSGSHAVGSLIPVPISSMTGISGSEPPAGNVLFLLVSLWFLPISMQTCRTVPPSLPSRCGAKWCKKVCIKQTTGSVHIELLMPKVLQPHEQRRRLSGVSVQAICNLMCPDLKPTGQPCSATTKVCRSNEVKKSE